MMLCWMRMMSNQDSYDLKCETCLDILFTFWKIDTNNAHLKDRMYSYLLMTENNF